MGELSDIVRGDFDKAKIQFRTGAKDTLDLAIAFGKGLVYPFCARSAGNSIIKIWEESTQGLEYDGSPFPRKEELIHIMGAVLGYAANIMGLAVALNNTDKQGQTLAVYASAVILGNLADNAVHYGLSLRERIRARVREKQHNYMSAWDEHYR